MSERLNALKSLIVEADVVADVGCDHGLIAEYCAVSGKAKRVIASDVSEKCLQKARTRLSGCANAEFICCDGIKYDCDEAVIAGMGGILISDILKSASQLPKTVVVGPHRNHDTLRSTLLSLGYGIERDVPMFDRGKFYALIRASIGGGETELSELQIQFGLDCAVPSDALKKRLTQLYTVYSSAPLQNERQLRSVIAAMRLQGVEPRPNNT